MLHFKMRFKHRKETTVIECRIIGNRPQIVHLLFISPINRKGHQEALSGDVSPFLSHRQLTLLERERMALLA